MDKKIMISDHLVAKNKIQDFLRDIGELRTQLFGLPLAGDIPIDDTIMSRWLTKLEPLFSDITNPMAVLTQVPSLLGSIATMAKLSARWTAIINGQNASISKDKLRSLHPNVGERMISKEDMVVMLLLCIKFEPTTASILLDGMCFPLSHRKYMFEIDESLSSAMIQKALIDNASGDMSKAKSYIDAFKSMQALGSSFSDVKILGDE